MDTNYSIPRRLWRILYPPIIFVAVQFLVMGVVAFVSGISIAYDALQRGISISDSEYVLEEALRFAVEHSMLILLVTNLICIAVFVPIWLRTRKRADPFENDKPALACLLVVGLFAAYNIIQMMVFALTDVMKYFPDYEGVTEMLVTDSFWIQLLSIGLVAPVAEELVFRGILITRMRWLPAWAAVLVQGVLFGLVHMNLFQGLYAFVAGILLGLIFVKFRSIIIVIAGHMAFNISSLLLSEFASERGAGVVVVASVILLPLCAVFTIIHKKARRLPVMRDIMPPPVYPAGP